MAWKDPLFDADIGGSKTIRFASDNELWIKSKMDRLRHIEADSDNAIDAKRAELRALIDAFVELGDEQDEEDEQGFDLIAVHARRKEIGELIKAKKLELVQLDQDIEEFEERLEEYKFERV
jgi:hypothetical protein